MTWESGGRQRASLLIIDGIINLVLGGLLVVFPSGLVETLGIPAGDERFYPTVLGAVLVGIGLALLIEANRLPGGLVGLGLGGALAINLAAAAALIIWLFLGDLAIPTRGRVLIGVLSVGLVAISAAELRTRWNRRP
ncbi:MAG: hypothetical protein P1T08_15950 [Acidimicrobiia bacterium]|nr:hypothetical protein [Acidimicrobiia bacterium]